MKEKLKKAPFWEALFYTQSPLIIARPALMETICCLGHLVSGFILACGQISGQAAPFALGFLSATGASVRGLCALLGASAGFLTMQSFAHGLQMTSAAILIYVTEYIFSSVWVAKQRWFCCLVPGIMTAAVGGIFLISKKPELLTLLCYTQTILLSALSPLCFSSISKGSCKNLGALMSVAFLILGADFIPLPLSMTLGKIAAILLVCAAIRMGDLGTSGAIALCTGLSLDVAGATGGNWCFLLSAGVLTGYAFPKKHRLWRLLGFSAGFSAAALFHGDLNLLPSLLPGLLLSLLFPGGIITGQEREALEEAAMLVEERLSFGQQALSRLYLALDPDPEQAITQQQILDRATGRICRKCSRYHSCWTRGGEETYALFHSAMETISQRGKALREDFPEEFIEDCRQMDGLLLSINEQLDTLAMEAQARTRVEELKTIVGRNLFHLSKILEESAGILKHIPRVPQEAFTAEVGVFARGRGGSKVSGDRGVCFQTADGRFFVILCDGAGTGNDGAKESLLAVDTLSGLIQSGMPTDNAMEVLNGFYVLRDGDSFSTMDILELNLITGQAALYKWGSAPSYVRSGGVVQKIGTAAPPPGLGVGSPFGGEILRLSLWGGDLVVLMSDGVVRRETEDLLRTYEGENVKELSALLVNTAFKAGGEDDMTAAVIRLEALKP